MFFHKHPFVLTIKISGYTEEALGVKGLLRGPHDKDILRFFGILMKDLNCIYDNQNFVMQNKMAATQLFFEDAFVFEGPAAEHLQFLICSEQNEFFFIVHIHS